MVKFRCYRCGKELKKPIEQNARYITATDTKTSAIIDVVDIRYKSKTGEVIVDKKEISIGEMHSLMATDVKEVLDFHIKSKPKVVQGTGLICFSCEKETDTVIW